MWRRKNYKKELMSLILPPAAFQQSSADLSTEETPQKTH